MFKIIVYIHIRSKFKTLVTELPNVVARITWPLLFYCKTLKMKISDYKMKRYELRFLGLIIHDDVWSLLIFEKQFEKTNFVRKQKL